MRDNPLGRPDPTTSDSGLLFEAYSARYCRNSATHAPATKQKMGPLVGPIFIFGVVIARSEATKQSYRDRRVGLRPPRDDKSTEARRAEGNSCLPLPGNRKPGIVPDNDSLNACFTPESNQWANIGLAGR